jgi:L-Ala-D/L-Glu epimerase / N-acetyl-D-glutamate racemase
MPMRRPFGHARATRALAESIVVCLDWDGHPGVGECVPRDYVTGESVASAYEALERLDLERVAADIDLATLDIAIESVERLQLPRRLVQGDVLGHAAACAIELALVDSITRRFATSVSALAQVLRLPAALLDDGAPHPRSRAWDSARSADELRELFEPAPAFRVLKIKVGLGLEQDLERLRVARSIASPSFPICVDANMAWTLDEACRAVEQLRPYDVAWFEEPLARNALADCAELRRRTGARIMLDESLCGFDQGVEAIERQACDLFNVRISKCGGLIASLRLIELAHRNGIGFQLGTHPGSQAILRAAEWQLANIVGGFVAMELAPSGSTLAEELIDEELVFDLPRFRCRPLHGPGLGITLRADSLERATRRG